MIETKTKDTFLGANGESVSYHEVFEAVWKNIEVYGRSGGRHLSSDDLEDLFQETAVKIIEHCGTFDSTKSQEKTWASRVAFSTRTDAFNEYMKRNSIFVNSISDTSSYDSFVSDRSVEEAESVEIIQDAIGSLRENYMYVLSLQLEGMKPKKMAEILECTPDAASIQLCRARKALKKKLPNDILEMTNR